MYVKTVLFSMSCLMASAALTPTANAGTAAGKLTIKAVIANACEVTSGNDSLIDFGTMDKLNPTKDAQSSSTSGIEVKCTNGVLYKIGLDAGLNPSTPDDFTTRRMKSGAGETIPYILLSDAKASKLWGNEDATMVKGTGNGEVQKYPVTARVTTSLTPSSGEYSDTVNVTLTY